MALAVASCSFAPCSCSARAPAGGALSPAVRVAMVEPWRPAAAAADPERFAAAAALLGAALAAHPSLTDALLFPAALAALGDAGAEVRVRSTGSSVCPEYCVPLHVSVRSVEYANKARGQRRAASHASAHCAQPHSRPRWGSELRAALLRAADKARPSPPQQARVGARWQPGAARPLTHWVMHARARRARRRRRSSPPRRADRRRPPGPGRRAGRARRRPGARWTACGRRWRPRRSWPPRARPCWPPRCMCCWRCSRRGVQDRVRATLGARFALAGHAQPRPLGLLLLGPWLWRVRRCAHAAVALRQMIASQIARGGASAAVETDERPGAQ